MGKRSNLYPSNLLNFKEKIKMHLIDLLKVDREVFFAFNQCCKYCFHTNHLMTELKLRTEGIKERIDREIDRERRNEILWSHFFPFLSILSASKLRFT